jgi:ribosome biogenesis GTPase
MLGLVARSTGSFYEVHTAQGTLTCRVRGKLRLEETKENNPIAVGDHVEVEQGLDYSSITQVYPRRNHVLRQSVKKTGHAQVLAANVDQVLLLATLKQPRTSTGFIDRFLISAESFRIPQVLVFNKMDLMNSDEKKQMEIWSQIYESIGVRVFMISSKNTDDVENLMTVFSNKTTLVAGHSGVGKSTLLNILLPGTTLPVGDISDFSEKGRHTTTFAEMFSMDDSTHVIDTPGVKEWGLVEMVQEEISDYFPEMRGLRSDCKFGYRCLHLNEPKCAVIEAVTQQKIALSRYESYISMAKGEDNRK